MTTLSQLILLRKRQFKHTKQYRPFFTSVFVLMVLGPSLLPTLKILPLTTVSCGLAGTVHFPMIAGANLIFFPHQFGSEVFPILGCNCLHKMKEATFARPFS